LDELLRTQGKARNDLTRIDDQQPEQIEVYRDKTRSHD
jgi:low affinity Fe/Cu permease